MDTSLSHMRRLIPIPNQELSFSNKGNINPLDRWIEGENRRRRALHTTKLDKTESKSATENFNWTKPKQRI